MPVLLVIFWHCLVIILRVITILQNLLSKFSVIGIAQLFNDTELKVRQVFDRPQSVVIIHVP